MEFKNLKVGKIYPQYIGEPDGIICNINDYGVSICITLDSPTENELQQLSPGTDIQFKVLKMRGLIFILFKFGNLQWMDAPYNVFLAGKISELPSIEDGQGYTATIEVYDTKSGKLCLQRLVALPTEMSRQLVSYMEEQFQEPLDITTLVMQKNEIYNAYSTKELVKFAPKTYKIRSGIFKCDDCRRQLLSKRKALRC